MNRARPVVGYNDDDGASRAEKRKRVKLKQGGKRMERVKRYEEATGQRGEGEEERRGERRGWRGVKKGGFIRSHDRRGHLWPLNNIDQ